MEEVKADGQFGTNLGQKSTENHQHLDLKSQKNVIFLEFFDFKIQKNRYFSSVFPPRAPEPESHRIRVSQTLRTEPGDLRKCPQPLTSWGNFLIGSRGCTWILVTCVCGSFTGAGGACHTSTAQDHEHSTRTQAQQKLPAKSKSSSSKQKLQQRAEVRNQRKSLRKCALEQLNISKGQPVIQTSKPKSHTHITNWSPEKLGNASFNQRYAQTSKPKSHTHISNVTLPIGSQRSHATHF